MLQPFNPPLPDRGIRMCVYIFIRQGVPQKVQQQNGCQIAIFFCFSSEKRGFVENAISFSYYYLWKCKLYVNQYKSWRCIFVFEQKICRRRSCYCKRSFLLGSVMKEMWIVIFLLQWWVCLATTSSHWHSSPPHLANDGKFYSHRNYSMKFCNICHHNPLTF